MQYYKVEKNGIPQIEFLLTFIIIIHETFYFVPLVAEKIRGVGNLILIVACLFLILVFDDQFINKFIKKSGWFLLYMILEIVYFLFVDNKPLLGVIVFALNLLTIFSIMLVLTKLTKKSKKSILFFTLSYFLFTICLTLKQLLIDPSFSRSIQDIDIKTESVLTGAGSYSFIYACVILLPILYMIYKSKINRKLTLLSLLLIPFIIIVVLKASYTIAILVILTMISVIILWNLRIKKATKIFIILAVATLIFYNTASMGSILMQISNELEIGPLQERLIELSYYFQGQTLSNTADLSMRKIVYMNSIDAFIHNPIFGRAFLPFDTNYNIGGHSFLLDIMGKYGIFSLTYFMFFFKVFKAQRGNEKNHKYYCITWVTFILLSLFNPISYYNNLFLLLVIAPIVCQLSIDI